jgi:hypothetical protein
MAGEPIATALGSIREPKWLSAQLRKSAGVPFTVLTLEFSHFGSPPRSTRLAAKHGVSPSILSVYWEYYN